MSNGTLEIIFNRPLDFEWSANAATDIKPLKDAGTQRRQISRVSISFTDSSTPNELKIAGATISSREKQNEVLERMDVLNSILWGRLSVESPEVTFKLNGKSINSTSQKTAVQELAEVTDALGTYFENIRFTCHT